MKDTALHIFLSFSRQTPFSFDTSNYFCGKCMVFFMCVSYKHLFFSFLSYRTFSYISREGITVYVTMRITVQVMV